MKEPNLDTIKTLSRLLMNQCAALGLEQTQILGVGRGTENRTLVLICTTDQATGRVLEFLDSQIETGQVEVNGGDCFEG